MAKQTKLKSNKINQLNKKAINRLNVEPQMEKLYTLLLHNHRS